MPFMNEYDIDDAVRVLEQVDSPTLRYAQYLSDWRDIINNNSDGWPYWKVGTGAAQKLMAAVSQAVDAAARGSDNEPSDKELRAAVTQIKSAATRRGLDVPVLAEG